MSLCAHCGQPTLDSDGELCAYHSAGGADKDTWATSNRIMCDFVHRRIVSPTPCEPADSSIELLLGRLEAALRA